VGRNEHSTPDQVFGGIDLFGRPHKRIAVRQPLIAVRVGGVTPITVAGDINQIASQPDEAAALSFEIQWQGRVSKTLTDSALKTLLVIANASHRRASDENGEPQGDGGQYCNGCNLYLCHRILSSACKNAFGNLWDCMDAATLTRVEHLSIIIF
jgi:hypothetical protein